MARNPWTQSEDEDLRVNYPKVSEWVLARHPITACRTRAFRLGITNSRRPRKSVEDVPLSPTQAAWLAGMIDGEGNTNGRNGNYRVVVTTTDVGIAAKLGTYPNVDVRERRTRTSTGKIVWDAVWGGKEIVRWLTGEVCHLMACEQKKQDMFRYSALTG